MYYAVTLNQYICRYLAELYDKSVLDSLVYLTYFFISLTIFLQRISIVIVYDKLIFVQMTDAGGGITAYLK